MKSWLRYNLPLFVGNRQAEEPVNSTRSVSFPFSEREPSYNQARYRLISGDASYGGIPALCRMCMSIDFQGLSTNRRPKDRYEARYGGLQPFSPNCPLCTLLREHVLQVTPAEASSDVVTFDFVPIYSTTVDGRKSNLVDGLWFRSGGKFGHLVFSAAPDNPASLEIKRRPPTNGYNCQEAYKLVRRWLGECSTHHELCRRDVNAILPTRVIDIGDATRGPTLYIPRHGTQGRYLALSYCWGKTQSVQLTEALLRSWPVEFPLRTLPPTLRDAIIIASHLGFQYIWIDALCIVQDSYDGQDWKRESVNMNRIYGNASMTIAAAAANSTAGGIFSFGTEKGGPTCSLPYQLQDGRLGNVNVGLYDTEDSTEESLDSRAWALQESLISPRLLRYGNQQMSWKCRQIEENANGPLINRSRLYASKSESWTSIVTNYTARRLTYNSDRLAALAGYAKLLSAKRPCDEYLVGLWKSELLEQLLWYRSTKSDPNPRPLSHYAPSWSWAAIDSPVRFSYWPLDYQSNSEVVDVSSGLSDRDPFSSLDGPQQCILSIYGYVKTIVYDIFFQESNGIPLFNSTHKFQSGRGTSREQLSGEVILDISGPFDAFAHGNTPSLICVHITPTCGLLCVAVKKQSEGDTDLYERIGLATGSVFEEWFTDTSCGSYKEMLVRIL